VKKYLLLLMTFILLSCSDTEKNSQTPNNKNNEKLSILKISEISNSNISEIYTNYDEAFKIAKEQNRAVCILFSTKYCRWCTKLKETTLTNPEIVKHFNSDFILLYLDRDTSLYPSKYKVKAVPNIYFTDKNEEIFTSVIGYHKNPKDYLKWFKYIKIELEQ